MGDAQAEAPARNRKQAAQERAQREQLERLEAAQKELSELQAEKKSEEEKAAVRVSLVEAEARVMKHGDHAIVPSYNAQISTEGKNKIIVGAHLSQCSSDAQSLMPALEEVAKNLGNKPAQVVVDGGFTNRENMKECAAQQIDLVGSLRDPQERSAAAMKALPLKMSSAGSALLLWTLFGAVLHARCRFRQRRDAAVMAAAPATRIRSADQPLERAFAPWCVS